MPPPVFLTEAWACRPRDESVFQTENTACISLAAVTGAELTAAAWTDGTVWSDATLWSDYPYLELVEDEAA